MMNILHYILVLTIDYVISYSYEQCDYSNRTSAASQQLDCFKQQHPVCKTFFKDPIGILTTSAGQLVEIRETTLKNSDPFANQYHIDLLTSADRERIPERLVHAKGTTALGYFIVTNDVSQYTKADVFNGVGKVTPVTVRFSSAAQDIGGSDLARDLRGMAVKFYTNEGNLDLLALSFAVFFHRDPNDFPHFVHTLKRNPKTNLFDFIARWDFITNKPETLHGILWLFSDFGIPNGFRKMDSFAIHTFEINNKHGEKYFVKFNFRSEQGIENLPSDVAEEISGRDPDYFNRELYDAIENGTYPVWTLEMDVMTMDDIKHIDYNPFEVTRLWKRGTYQTVPIGQLILNRNPDNMFRTTEQSAFNPGNLVPGIPGPIDILYRSRRLSYRDTQNYRLGINHNRIEVNTPKYYKVYNRDGKPPLRENMKDIPNYYPNSFHGPVPFVDLSRPKERLFSFDVNAVDLDQAEYFYNYYLDSDQRKRLINNTVPSLVTVPPELRRRVIRLLTLTDESLGQGVAYMLEKTLRMPPPPPPPVLSVTDYENKCHYCH